MDTFVQLIQVNSAIMENRGAWGSIVHGVAKRWTRLNDWMTITIIMHMWEIFAWMASNKHFCSRKTFTKIYIPNNERSAFNSHKKEYDISIKMIILFIIYESESHSVMSDSLRPPWIIQSVELSRPEYWSG